MNRPLKVCLECGIEAWSNNDLASTFVYDKRVKSKYRSKCKKCEHKRIMDYKYRTKFNLSYDDITAMKECRSYCCDICGREETSAKFRLLNVDHCHTTGEVRGILCGRCNTVLGHLGDDVAILARAIEYLNGGNV